MKSFLSKLKFRNINVFVYRIDKCKPYVKVGLSYEILREKVNSNKIRYYIFESNSIVHESYLFSKIFLLRCVKKTGPVIGDCMTNKKFRGQSIYPYVINHIVNETLSSDVKEVFVIVNKSNPSSIRGIEKAGFNKFASIKSNKWLLFYFNKKIKYF